MEYTYPLRIDRELMNKFKTVASANGRSVNKEIEQMIKQAVSLYEKENGPIEVSSDTE